MNSIEVIKKLTCKVVSKNEHGSGFIYALEEDNDFCYIITARHCIYGKNFDNGATVDDIKLELLYINGNLSDSYQLIPPDTVLVEEGDNLDFAAIKVPRSVIESKIGSLPNTKLLSLSENNSDCYFRGYPLFTENQAPRTIEGNLETRDEELPKFHFKVRYDFLHHVKGLPEDLVLGLSGSGICIDINDEIYLYGIVIEYEAAENRFICLTLNLLQEKIAKGILLHDIKVEKLLPKKWFLDHVKKSSKNLGPRFTWDNYPVALEKQFEPFARTERFLHEFHLRFTNSYTSFVIFQNEILSKTELFLKPYLHKRIIKTEFPFFEKNIILATAFARFRKTFSDLNDCFDQLNFLDPVISKLSSFIQEVQYLIDFSNLLSKFIKIQQTKVTSSSEVNQLEEIRKLIQNINHDLQSLKVFLTANADLLNANYVLISGPAGNGKSQLLAFVANKRLERGYSSLLILGQRLLKSYGVWEQILSELGLACSVEDFLLALNTKGEIEKKIIIIFIDALNEGQGILLWNSNIVSFLDTIKNYSSIRVVLSYRSTYKEALFKGIDISNAVNLEHKGFLGFEKEAASFFYKIHDIEHAKVPSYHAEFKNPLFLKLFCIAVKSGGFAGDIDSFKGISFIIDHFLRFVNAELGHPRQFDYRSENLNLVKKVVQAFIKRIIEKQSKYLNYEDAFILTEQVVSVFLNKRGYLNGLINEEVFYENLVVFDDQQETVVEFSYEVFGEHLKVAALIENKSVQDVISAFKKGGEFFLYFSNEYNIRNNRGLLEAFIVQIREKFKISFDDIDADLPHFEGSKSSTISAIMVATKEFISPITLNFIEQEIKLKESIRELFWDHILIFSSDKTNYFNGFYLHRFLINLKMDERDFLWTAYLNLKFESLDNPTAVAAVIQRCLNKDTKNVFNDEDEMFLTVITLTWFLSSTNRKIRDYSTKLLILLLSNKIGRLIELIELFKEVDDRYILQRIYAVSYGCAVRTEQIEELTTLCNVIFEKVFNKEQVVADILIRDYCRETIEYAMNLGITFRFDASRIRPPYKSTPFGDFPSNDEIDNYVSKNDLKDLKESGSYGLWKIMRSMVTEYGRGTSNYGDFGRYVFGSAVSHWREIDQNMLSNLAIQMIVYDYGYDTKTHGKFDTENNFQRRNRNYSEIERIGKKYQWLALHEILARLADNYNFYGDNYSSRAKPIKYEGPWNPFIRDIDPTIVVPYYQEKRNKIWFNKVLLPFWEGSNEDWIRDKNVLKTEELIEFIDTEDEEWLVLERHVDYRNAEKESDESYREIWYQVRSYLVTSDEYNKIVSWGKNKNFMGRWMPESSSIYQLFNREFYWAPPVKTFATEHYYGQSDVQQLSDSESNKKVGEVIIPVTQYLWESENDYSWQGKISMFKPSKTLFELLKLKYSSTDGEMLNELNEMVCFDPSITKGGPSCLLVKKRELLKRLKENNLRILWTLLGEKRINSANIAKPSANSQVLEISGIVSESRGKLNYNINYFNR